MRNRLYSGVALAVLALSVPAYAQQQGQQVELETINIEGQGKKAGAQHGDPQPTVATEAETVLTERATREELDRRHVSDPTDINKIAPGVSYSPSMRSFNVRGLSNQRVLTTIDGIPLPYLDDGARGTEQGSGVATGASGGVASVDFDSLSSVDIVKGSDSSVFGSGMLGGGVRFRTLEPEDLIEEGNKFGGLTKFGFDSRDNSWRAEQALAGRVDNTFVLIQGGYRDGEEMENKGTIYGPGSTRTEKNPADYDQENLLVKLRHYTDGGHMIGFTGERFSREEDITPLTQNQATYNIDTVNTVETNRRERVSLDYRYDGGGWLDQAEATAFWLKQELGDKFSATRISTPVGDYMRDNTREQEIYGVNGSALKIIESTLAEHRVSFGTQIYGKDSHQYSAGVDNCGPGPFPPFTSCNFLHSNQSDMPDVEGLTAAAFIQDEMAFLNDTVRLTPGLRFDYYRETPQYTDEYARSPAYSSYGLPDESSDMAVSPKLRLEVDTPQSFTLFAQWAQGFRAPTTNELYLTYGAPGTYLSIGDPDLESETSNGFDIGVLAGDSRNGGSVKFFYNRYKNYIDDIDLDTSDPAVVAYLASLGHDAADYPFGVTQTVNRANVQIYGAEVEAHVRHESGWHGWGQFGAYIGEDMDLNEGLNTIPAAKVVLGVGYEQENWGADVIFTAAAARDEDDLENAASATPSYQLIDFTAWWSPAAVEGLTIRAGIFNITDEKYYEDALDISTATNKEYYTQPGRNVRVSATYKF